MHKIDKTVHFSTFYNNLLFSAQSIDRTFQIKCYTILISFCEKSEPTIVSFTCTSTNTAIRVLYTSPTHLPLLGITRLVGMVQFDQFIGYSLQVVKATISKLYQQIACTCCVVCESTVQAGNRNWDSSSGTRLLQYACLSTPLHENRAQHSLRWPASRVCTSGQGGAGIKTFDNQDSSSCSVPGTSIERSCWSRPGEKRSRRSVVKLGLKPETLKQ